MSNRKIADDQAELVGKSVGIPLIAAGAAHLQRVLSCFGPTSIQRAAVKRAELVDAGACAFCGQNTPSAWDCKAAS